MAKSGRQYADDVRELRAQGLAFPAARGYRLADAANWSSGQKAAVTRAINLFDFSAFDAAEERKAARKRKPKPKRKPKRKPKPKPKPKRKPKPKPKPKPRRRAPIGAAEQIDLANALKDREIQLFFDDAVGDDDEDWDDIPYFDFDEADDLIDEENDNYDEAPS